MELKVGKFEPADVGQLQFYLTALDEQEKLPEENPSIGVIACRSKNRTVVEYALRNTASPMGVATYTTSEDLPDNLRKALPDIEQLKKLLNNTDK